MRSLPECFLHRVDEITRTNAVPGLVDEAIRVLMTRNFRFATCTPNQSFRTSGPPILIYHSILFVFPPLVFYCYPSLCVFSTFSPLAAMSLYYFLLLFFSSFSMSISVNNQPCWWGIGAFGRHHAHHPLLKRKSHVRHRWLAKAFFYINDSNDSTKKKNQPMQNLVGKF